MSSNQNRVRLELNILAKNDWSFTHYSELGSNKITSDL